MVGILSIGGFVMFTSASLGLIAQGEDTFQMIVAKQGISLAIGVGLFFVISRIKYVFWRKMAFFILLGAIGINLLLYIPGLALHYGGATRWIDLGFISFQPSEFLKIGFIIYMSAWVFFAKEKIKTFRYGLLPYIVLMAILTTLLLLQSDTDTLVIIGFTGALMLFIAGMPLRHLLGSGLIMAVIVGGVIYFRPYARERVMTYFNEGANSQSSGYQINQSLIAIGSGQLTGRGFGQSIQKFSYLPQPTDDSIFAVTAEEFGFIGSTILISLYLLLAASLFRIANKAEDYFAGMVAVGIGILIVSESFLNIGAMMGLIPLSGLPLLFVSHGGTALIITLASAGIVANISKYIKK
jgi:cell division protein FtsW